MGCLISRFYDASLRLRALKKRRSVSSLKYKLDNDNGDGEEGFLDVTAVPVTPVDEPDRGVGGGGQSNDGASTKKKKVAATLNKQAKKETKNLGSTSSSKTASATKKDEPKKEYSWEKRRKLDPKDFMCLNTEDQVVVKEPGKINGQQFVIDGCARCTILVFDHCASVTIDDCEDCTIFIGPTESSVFIRNCKNCKCVFLCRQLRTRDCEGCSLKLFCSTRPVIESSKDMAFGCFDCDYQGLSQQLKNAHLSAFCNYWSSIYDFTPPSGGSVGTQNWHFLDETRAQDMKGEIQRLQEENGLSTQESVAFKTFGEKPVDDEYHYLVLFSVAFGQDDSAAEAAKQFLEGVGVRGSVTPSASDGGAKLIQVNGCKLTREELNEMNSSNILDDGGALPNNAEKVVGLEISSANSIKSAVMQTCSSKLSAYRCILVGDLDLMRAFRTKGITG